MPAWERRGPVRRTGTYWGAESVSLPACGEHALAEDQVDVAALADAGMRSIGESGPGELGRRGVFLAHLWWVDERAQAVSDGDPARVPEHLYGGTHRVS